MVQGRCPWSESIFDANRVPRRNDEVKVAVKNLIRRGASPYDEGGTAVFPAIATLIEDGSVISRILASKLNRAAPLRSAALSLGWIVG